MYRTLLAVSLFFAAAILCCIGPSTAHAYPWGGDIYDLPFDSPLDALPSLNETDSTHNSITYPGHSVDSLSLHGFSPSGSGLASPPDSSAPSYAADSFFDVFVDVTVDGNSWTASGVGEIHIGGNDLLPADTIFDTELIQLDISHHAGDTLPSNVMIRESHSQTSTGQIEVQDIGGGQFRIDSFFDVFTELSVDGGNTWLPSNGSVNLGSTPEPSTLVLLGMGGSLLGIVARRRRSSRA